MLKKNLIKTKLLNIIHVDYLKATKNAKATIKNGIRWILFKAVASAQINNQKQLIPSIP